MSKYVVGHNMPGFMPDSEPSECDNVKDAISCLMFDVEAEAIDLTDPELMKMQPDAPNEMDAYNSLIGAIEKMVGRHMRVHGEASVSFNGRVFWIHRV